MSAQGSALGWFAKPAKATDLVMGGIRKPRAWVMARHQRWRRTRELVLVPYRLRWLYDRMSAVTSKCTTHGHFKVHHPLGLNG